MDQVSIAGRVGLASGPRVLRDGFESFWMMIPKHQPPLWGTALCWMLCLQHRSFGLRGPASDVLGGVYRCRACFFTGQALFYRIGTAEASPATPNLPLAAVPRTDRIRSTPRAFRPDRVSPPGKPASKRTVIRSARRPPQRKVQPAS